MQSSKLNCYFGSSMIKMVNMEDNAINIGLVYNFPLFFWRYSEFLLAFVYFNYIKNNYSFGIQLVAPSKISIAVFSVVGSKFL